MKLGKDQDRPQVYTIDPNPISYVFVSWITSLVWKGSKKPIAKDDLFDLNPKDSSTYIDGWISQFWAEYDSFGKQQRKELPRLWGSMMSYARGFLWVSPRQVCDVFFMPFLASCLLSSGSFLS